MTKALFIALATTPYRWFQSGAKTWELRRVGRQYQPARLPAGRPATLSRGYSTPDRLPATVCSHVVGDSIADVLTAVGWRNVIPDASSAEHAAEIATRIMGDKPGPFIAIQLCVSTPRT